MNTLMVWSSDSIIIRAPIENKEAGSYKPFSKVNENQTTINFFNTRSDSRSTNLNKELVGGISQECKKYLEILSRTHVEQSDPQLGGEDTVKYAYDLEEKRVYYPPYTLDPENTTFDGIKNHAITRQNIALSTADKYLGLAKLMETHPIFPVDFRTPHWTNFFHYMDHIKINEGATPDMLKNRRNAWMMFCRAWGTAKEWPTYKLPYKPDRTKDIVIPTPETVNKMLQYQYTGDKYLNRLIQYHFFTGFMIGMRPEKEMVILNVDDINIDESDNYTIHIMEPKKRGDSRILRLENTIAISKTRKSFKNYIETIRPRFADENENALLVNPNTGRRWTEDTLRHNLLSRYGKIVWPRFWPYVMRHWCATARCIEWKKDNTVLYRVKYWLGHKKLDQTLRYIDLAKLYDQGKGSWLSRVLKRHKNVGGKPGLTGEERNNEKNGSFVPISPRRVNGRGGILSCSLLLKSLITLRKTPLLNV